MSTAALAPTGSLDEIKSLVKRSSSLSDVVKELAKVFAQPVVPSPAKLPEITETQHKALETFVSVYGKVAPLSRRELTTQEITDLVIERLTIDELLKLTESRKEAIRTTIYNHLDVEAEKAGKADPETTPRDKYGFYVLPESDEARGNGQAKVFRREPRAATASLSNQDLLNLEADGVITHDEYLKCTSQVRVVDEHATLGLLKDRPELLSSFGKTLKITASSSALNMRNS